jgi:hypothetical protein
MVCCRDAAASSFVAKVQDEIFVHFYAVTVYVEVTVLPDRTNSLSTIPLM